MCEHSCPYKHSCSNKCSCVCGSMCIVGVLYRQEESCKSFGKAFWLLTLNQHTSLELAGSFFGQCGTSCCAQREGRGGGCFPQLTAPQVTSCHPPSLNLSLQRSCTTPLPDSTWGKGIMSRRWTADSPCGWLLPPSGQLSQQAQTLAVHQSVCLFVCSRVVGTSSLQGVLVTWEDSIAHPA